ncbi:MAG TPA: alpha/beta hydrolase [Casimicrobiaceae bacterium]|nr:alpha/beta hydrolase [Casimicrobiaceae bacterium]
MSRAVVKASTSQFIAVRGLSYHVRTWGVAAAPLLVMLHGWMDVGASFQFLVDRLTRDWRVVAPDWRGFGESEWCTDGYWFADYVADLDHLLSHFTPDAPARVVGHSLGGNVACIYAGVRPERVSRLVSLEGFGIPAEAPEQAPDKMAKWLAALRESPSFAPYANLAAVADRLQKNNPRMPRDKADFLAAHWAEALPDGSAQLRSDPRHKLPFPIAYRVDEVRAAWQRVTAPVLWVAAAESFVPRWLGEDEVGLARRVATFRDGRLVTIAGAGHMLHHDQPAAVAAAIEPFLAG